MDKLNSDTNVINISNWRDVNLNLLTKILTEFMYEDLLITEVINIGENKFQHILKISSTIYYTFIASPRIFGSWRIDKSSIRFHNNGAISNDLYVNEFICTTYKLIGINEITLGHLLRELSHTLIADCHLLELGNTNKKLLSLNDFSLLEGYMTGHPWFVINKGRLGFSYNEYLNYAPEMRNCQRLAWLAVKTDIAKFSAVDNLTYKKLINFELSTSEIEKFVSVLDSQQLDSNDYYYMPVHEWQWQRQIIQLFVDDIANKNIIYLGYGESLYLATQSIRSFNNQTRKNRYQVKLPLSIFNTAVYRGLPGKRTELAPLLTQWIKNVLANDPFFNQSKSLIMLGEIAGINYPHKIYNNLYGVPYQYQELLGTIWRENVNEYILDSEQVITMASLIHIDANNVPFICSLVDNSKAGLSDWLERFFAVCIPPLLHWLYKYGVVFSAHGENTMLVLDENYYPSRLVLKDFIDDVNITNRDIPELASLPHELLETLYRLPDDELIQFIHTGLFVVLYRYLSDILYTYMNYSETRFWQQVHDTIAQYHEAYPEFHLRIKDIDIFKAEFKKLNLNRLRLINVGYADYAKRPVVESVTMMHNPVNPDYLKYWGSLNHDLLVRNVNV
jgi:siderophore synthetase component